MVDEEEIAERSENSKVKAQNILQNIEEIKNSTYECQSHSKNVNSDSNNISEIGSELEKIVGRFNI